MSQALLHGVETVESLSGTVAVVEVSSTVMAVFGTSEFAAAGDFYHSFKLEDAELFMVQALFLTPFGVFTVFTPQVTQLLVFRWARCLTFPILRHRPPLG